MSAGKKDEIYLRMAHLWAGNSHAVRLKVGALIVKDSQIISDGYNGTPSGFDNCCETYEGRWLTIAEAHRLHEEEHKTLTTKREVLHAEANAISKLARSTQSSEGATLYVTDSPCFDCAKMIIQSGIKRVVFDRKYRITDGIELLERSGVKVEHLPLKDERL